MAESKEGVLKEQPDTNTKYGLWDIRDKCWPGKEEGPLAYTDHMMARAAATITTERLGRYIRPLPLPPKPFVLKDEITPKLSALEAIKSIEKKAKQ